MALRKELGWTLTLKCLLLIALWFMFFRHPAGQPKPAVTDLFSSSLSNAPENQP
ncbi:MAG: hypothetical protein RIQ52_713 [Pseudomonadota bacterium]|jgi:hypothetical protein